MKLNQRQTKALAALQAALMEATESELFDQINGDFSHPDVINKFCNELDVIDKSINDSKEEKPNAFVEILQHRVEFWFQGVGAPDTMDEANTEHVESLIKEGYNQGELFVHDDEGEILFRGWWTLKDN